MTAFPEALPPQIPYTWSPKFLTKLGGPYETPVLDARVVWPYPQMTANLTWGKRVIPNSDYVALYDFFVACRGRAISFTFFDFNNWKGSPVGIQWNDIYVGVRNGVAALYDLPGKNMTSIVVKDNGTTLNDVVADPITPDYAITPGAGTDGRDTVNFLHAYAAGTAGHTVTVSFVGRLGIRAHWTADEMPFDTFYTSVQAKGLTLEQVF